MPLRHVLATLDAQTRDAANGLVARAMAIAAAAGWPPGHLVTAVSYVPWRTAGHPQPATSANFAILPTTENQELRAVKAGQRKGQHRLQAEFELTGVHEQRLVDNLAAYSEALVQLLEDADQYSRAHGGTIVSVEEVVSLTYGTFAGPLTTAGFTGVFTVFERSSQ